MNKLSIIGNLVADPTIREVNVNNVTVKVCNFTVAANDGFGEHRRTSFIRCTAWRGLGESCAKYLSKGKKVGVIGPVSVSVYTSTQDGSPRASLELRVEDIEFLSPSGLAQTQAPATTAAPQAPAETAAEAQDAE